MTSALLEELKQQRKSRIGASPPSETAPQPDDAASLNAEPDDPSTTSSADTDDDEWLSDELVEEAVDTASREWFIADDSPMDSARLPDDASEEWFVDDSPMDSARLPGADLGDANSSSQDAAGDIDGAEAQASVSPPDRSFEAPGDESTGEAPQPPTTSVEKSPDDATAQPPPSPDATREDASSEAGVEVPLTITAPEADDGPSLADLEPTAKTYRLRIGDEVYGDIDFEGLIALFRRGVWVVADEIAEDDGPWTPIESHPVFERLRHVIAQGVTNVLLTHARLVDEKRSGDSDATPEPDDQSPSKSIADVRVEPTPADEIATDDVVTPVRPASATLPWTIALISTGVASATVAGVTGAAVAYAFFADPEDATDEPREQATVSADAFSSHGESDRTAAADDTQLIDPPRADVIDEVRDTVERAADPDGRTLVEQALKQRDYEQARKLAAHYAARDHDRAAYRSLFERAVADDPHFDGVLRTMTPDDDVDALRALGGGSSVTLRFTRDGDEQYAYKVARDDWEEGWRSEVAAYQLSKLLPTDLYVPENEPARISRPHFEELYGRVNTPRQHSYADERFDELFWQHEAGPDGVEREFLYGTLKEWIPRYTNWPIEYVETWKQWLDPTTDVDFGDAPDEFLDRLEQSNRRAADALEPDIEGHTKGELARQLSNLHVFDYLINNFDRYSGVEDYYGVNAHFADGRFIPIDNSHAFQFRDRPELDLLDERLQTIGRFSHSLIEAIRMMDPEFVDPVLFPDPGADELRRLEFFWQQREKLLDHVDTLVDKHGEEAVYAFD